MIAEEISLNYVGRAALRFIKRENLARINKAISKAPRYFYFILICAVSYINTSCDGPTA